MVNSAAPAAVGDLVEAFTAASPGRLAEEFPGLVATVWQDGTGTASAVPAVRGLMARLDEVDTAHLPRLAVLLGLLAEAEPPELGAAVVAAVRPGLDRFLELWRQAPSGGPLSLALLFLLGHFPDDRERILRVARAVRLDADDLSRLDRALQRLDPARPVLGRAFPSPLAWDMDEDEREFDRAWIASLSPEQVVWHWHNDTETVRGHAGAKAYWAVLNGAPGPVVADSAPPRTPAPRTSTDPAVLLRHAAALRCPSCRGELAFFDTRAQCARCRNAYATGAGLLDVTATVGDRADRGDDFLFALAEMPSMGYFYEAHARPNFLRLCGSNWGGQLSPTDEDAYITEHVRPVEGPVLDLAAGAGRWTRVLSDAVGVGRVIALDLALPMLAALRTQLPAVAAVRSSANPLPFGDATLGAVLCWNALQAFPQDAPAAVAEVGRCLRPGGTFTLLTYRNSDDPVYRYFVGRHHFPQHTTGLRLFDLDEVQGWLDSAGLAVRDLSGPGTFVILTAERTGR